MLSNLKRLANRVILLSLLLVMPVSLNNCTLFRQKQISLLIGAPRGLPAQRVEK